MPLSQMLSELMQSRAGLGLLRGTGLGELLLAGRVHGQAPLRFVQDALDKRGQARVKALAHCFCEPM
jgi:protease-4